MVMDLNAQKEQFSNAFLLAVTAVAGCAVSKPSVDDDSIDWTVSNRLPRSPKMDVQLKCTTGDDGVRDPIPFVLPLKNYNDLIANTIIPRILVLVTVPRAIGDWITLSQGELALRRCARWVSLAGRPPTENLDNVIVHIPRANVLDVESVESLMERVSRGEPL
jgi:hypothetical protein